MRFPDVEKVVKQDQADNHGNCDSPSKPSDLHVRESFLILGSFESTSLSPDVDTGSAPGRTTMFDVLTCAELLGYSLVRIRLYQENLLNHDGDSTRCWISFRDYA